MAAVVDGRVMNVICSIVEKLNKSKQKSDVTNILQKVNSNRDLKKFDCNKYGKNELAQLLEEMTENGMLDKENKSGSSRYIAKENDSDSGETEETSNSVSELFFESKMFNDAGTQTDHTDSTQDTDIISEKIAYLEMQIKQLTSLYLDVTKDLSHVKAENASLLISSGQHELLSRENQQKIQNIENGTKIQNRTKISSEANDTGNFGAQSTAWKTVTKGFSVHTAGGQENTITLQNRFNPLAEKTHADQSACLDRSQQGMQPPSFPAQPAQNVNNSQDTSEAIPVKVVPGHQTYNKAHLKTISFCTDSMSRSIRNVEFNQDIKNYNIPNVECRMHKFPGADAEDIGSYSKYNIEKDKAHGLIVVAGTNSLKTPRGQQTKNTDEEIARQILDIGKNGKQLGVEKIIISSIIVRRGHYYQQRINNINKILEFECRILGFVFINNSNISLSHLNHQDGLHLNDEGTKIFKSNILKMLF